MIYSTTGYAVKTRDVERGTLQLELKGVNSRYLDLHFQGRRRIALSRNPAARAARLPPRPRQRSRMPPGLQQRRRPRRPTAPQRRPAGHLKTSTPASAPNCRGPALSVNEVLRWPGVFGDQTIDFAAMGPLVPRTGQDGHRRIRRHPRPQAKTGGHDPRTGRPHARHRRRRRPRIPEAQAYSPTS